MKLEEYKETGVKQENIKEAWYSYFNLRILSSNHPPYRMLVPEYKGLMGKLRRMKEKRETIWLISAVVRNLCFDTCKIYDIKETPYIFLGYLSLQNQIFMKKEDFDKGNLVFSTSTGKEDIDDIKEIGEISEKDFDSFKIKAVMMGNKFMLDLSTKEDVAQYAKEFLGVSCKKHDRFPTVMDAFIVLFVLMVIFDCLHLLAYFLLLLYLMLIYYRKRRKLFVCN